MSSFRSGIAAIIGRPNAGKSTLLNRLLGEKLAIVSPKPQTTRNRILGAVSRPGAQLLLLDTPGIHQAKGELNRFMVDVALGAIDEADLVLYVAEAAIDARGNVEPGETAEQIAKRLRAAGKPVILALNKCDRLARPVLLPIIDTWRKLYPFTQIVPISALKNEGLDLLEQELTRLLPEGEPLLPADQLTDAPESFFVGELIREQVLRSCREEIPYSAAVVIDHFDESEREPLEERPGKALSGLVRIAATLFVERDSQKAIVIGKRGAMLKSIGEKSRHEIERLLGAHVYLSLLVKVEPRWSERVDGLGRMGYRR